MLRVMRFLIRAILILVCLPLTALALYTAAAFGALLLAPEGSEPEEGVLIYACDNGVHTDLVVPVMAGGTDWRALFGQRAFVAPVTTYEDIAFGWGSRDFYINTPTWADLDIATALKSVLWDETVLHVEYLPEPVDRENCRPWRADPGAYARITRHVRKDAAAVGCAAGAGGAGLWRARCLLRGERAIHHPRDLQPVDRPGAQPRRGAGRALDPLFLPGHMESANDFKVGPCDLHALRDGGAADRSGGLSR